MYEENASFARQSWRLTAIKVMRQFDPDWPGRGTDSHTGDISLDHAMAYALYASSAKLLGMQQEASLACSWLEKDAKKKSGATGWGLPFEWDAFADGDPNPVDTVYGITTALCVKALVDCSPEGTVNETATTALEYYLKVATQTEDGLFFWYSDRINDAKNVFNVSSMLAGQYARVGHILGRLDFIDAARAVAANLLANRQEGKNGYFWNYGADIDRPNDAVHASYVVQGAIELKRWLDVDIGLQFALMYLRKFFRNGMALEFVKHEGLPRKKLNARARPWGVGMLLYTACESNDWHLRSLAETAIQKVFPPTDNETAAKSFHPRHLGHIAIGLARASLEAKVPYYPQVMYENETSVTGNELSNLEKKPHIVSLVMNGVVGDGRVIKTAKAALDAGYKATLIGMTNNAKPIHLEVEGVPVILVPNGLEKLQSNGLWGTEMSKRRLGALSDSVMWSMLPEIEALNPSLLHSHDMSGLRIGAMISRNLAAKGWDIPWIHDIHEYVVGLTTVPENYRATCMDFERRYLHQADHLTTVSDPLAEVVRSTYHLRLSPTVIYNAPLANADPVERVGDIRTAIELNQETPLVVYIGVAKKERGCETLVAAAASLPGVHICFISDSNKYLAAIKKLADELGMADRLHLHPCVSSSEVTSFIRTADIGFHGLIHYPNGEVALPNKLFEYIHAGLPVVVSDVAAMKQFVEKNGIGTVFEAESPQSCAVAIDDALKNISKYASKITDDLKKIYSWQEQSEKLKAIYSQLIQSKLCSDILVLSENVPTSSNLARALDGAAIGVVSSTAPAEGIVDFYHDPGGQDDRAGVLTRLANRYRTIVIHHSSMWPDMLDRAALASIGARVFDVGPGELVSDAEMIKGISDHTAPSSVSIEADSFDPSATLMRHVEERQLAYDKTVSELVYAKESAECLLESYKSPKFLNFAQDKTTSPSRKLTHRRFSSFIPIPIKKSLYKFWRRVNI